MQNRNAFTNPMAGQRGRIAACPSHPILASTVWLRHLAALFTGVSRKGEINAAGRGGCKIAYSHLTDMVSHMKTTLNIDDTVMTRLRREANRQGRTMSELVEMALRLLFQSAGPKSKTKLPPLPRMHSGGHLVDIADRNALYQAMEGKP